MLLWIVAALAHAGCDLVSLQQGIQDGEAAFAEMEPQAFQEAVDYTDRALECQGNQITPIEAAGYHRLKALAAFFAADSNATLLYFQSVQGTQPGYQLPESIAPPGHPLREDFERAKQFATNETFALPEPAEGWLNVDGRRSGVAPSGRPYVFQRLEPSGLVAQSSYQMVGAPLPSYPIKVVAPPPEPSKSGSKKLPVKLAGIGLGVVGAGLYGTAFATRGGYTRAVADGDRARIDSAKGTTNALTIASISSLVAGAGITVVGFTAAGS